MWRTRLTLNKTVSVPLLPRGRAVKMARSPASARRQPRARTITAVPSGLVRVCQMQKGPPADRGRLSLEVGTLPRLSTLLSLLLLLLQFSPSSGARDCPRCAAVANELERQMHEEWSHLNLTSRDHKRHAAKDAAALRACTYAVDQMLRGICKAVKQYAIGDGGRYYQKINDMGGDMIVVTGSITISSADDPAKLHPYCTQLLAEHEERLSPLMADGTDDLITDLCIRIARECTEAEVAAIPEEGLPRHRTLLRQQQQRQPQQPQQQQQPQPQQQR